MKRITNIRSHGALGLSIAAILIGLFGLAGGIVAFLGTKLTLFSVAVWLSFAGLLVGVAAIVITLRRSKAQSALLIGLLSLSGGVVTFLYGRFALLDVAAGLSLVGLLVGIIAIAIAWHGSTACKTLIYAILGVVLCCPVPSIAAIVYVTAAERRRFAEANTLYYDMVRLHEATQSYAKSHEGRLPEADAWFDSLRQVNAALPDNEFRHPLYPEISVAYNAALAGRRIAEVSQDAVLFFEGKGGRNLAGGPELLPPSALTSDVYIMLVKGTIQMYRIEHQGTHGPNYEFIPVRWEP